MILFRAASSVFAWFADTAIRLLVWAAFSAVCYSAVAILPFDFLGSLMIGGWVGVVFDVFRIIVAVAILYTYLYYSAMIFFTKEFPISW